jgi:hypothetical protein
MLQVLVLTLVVVLIVKIVAPVPAFLRGFASLLQNPERGRAGLRALFSGARYVGGENGHRPVVLLISPTRGRRHGYLTVAMGTGTAGSWDGSKPTEGTQVSSARMREALDALIGTHGLVLDLTSGWLRATWKPAGVFAFPGRFESDKWREVLERMHTLAAELEETERVAAQRQTVTEAPTSRAATEQAIAPPAIALDPIAPDPIEPELAATARTTAATAGLGKAQSKRSRGKRGKRPSTPSQQPESIG